MNFTEQIGSCGHKVLVSHDELQIIGVPPCTDCDNQTAKFIRHKAVYGFYDLPEVTDEIIEAIIRKEFNNGQNGKSVLLDSKVRADSDSIGDNLTGG